MAYQDPAPPSAPPPRPATVTLAVVVLAALALGGTAYAIVGLAVVGGVLDRYRELAAAAGATAAEIDSLAVLPVGLAVLATILALAVAGLLLVLARGLARRQAVARLVTWLVSATGLLCGGVTLAVVVAQRAVSPDFVFDPVDTTVVTALAEAYPRWWLPLGAALPVAQVLGYLVVALLLCSPAANRYFRRTARPASSAPAADVWR